MLTDESSAFEATYAYNDLQSVRAAVASLGADGVAAIFVGGCSYPYSAPTLAPTPEFVRGLRQIADECGAVIEALAD